jgi:hypothetical protein
MVFGPEWWRGDAIVAGQSRGKIWRVKLVKTAAGYVAKSELIACVAYLTIDAVPTPDGGLLVACHTGDPDCRNRRWLIAKTRARPMSFLTGRSRWIVERI